MNTIYKTEDHKDHKKHSENDYVFIVESVDVNNPNDRAYLRVKDLDELEMDEMKRYLNDELE